MKKNDVKNDSRKDNNLMVKIATFIVDKRRAFYLIFALALVLCVISIPKVQVNNDISSYLPEETETRRGLTLMDDEFITYDTEKIMVTTITTETAEKLKDKLEKVDGVKEVEFENDDDHYKDSAALFTVTLSVRDDLDRELEIVDDLKAQLDGYDFYAYSDSIDDSSKQLEKEMTVILGIALVIIIAVLLFTSQSFMEVPIFLIVFGVALIDAKTGEEAFHVSDSNDTGRGLIANTGMGGYYQMSSNAGTYVAYGNNVFKKVNASMGQNFRIFWDGDLYDEELDLSSMVVKAYYSDKTSKTITDYTVSGYDSTKVGKQTVTVHYLDMTDTFDVTVAEGELSSIEIASNPSKTTYFTGEQLDTSGLSVKLNYANNSSKTITDGFDVSGFDNQTVGTNTLTVSYGGKTTTFTVTIVNSELTSYVNDDFESYDDSQITLKSQTLTKQTQDLGPFKLTLGTSGKKTDSYPHFAILTDNGNKSLEIATGGMSNPSRGPIIEFGDSIALPDFADIPANKYLVFDFDALYQGDTSNVQLYGVTDSYLSTSSDKLTYDQYLSVNKNANIPIGKWVNIHLVVNSKKDLFLTISDKSGNVLDSRKVTTSGDKFEKFVFYGGVGKIQLDNLKIYEDKISSLTLTPPTKTSYALGEELNLDGMVAKLNYSDKSVGTTAYTVSGYDKTKVGKQTVTVSYGDYSANFDVTVNGISSIEVTPPTKTTYLEGQDLNTDGMVVTAVTSDNQRITVPAGYSVRGFNKTKLGKQTITVTYQGLSTEFEVNVNSVKSIELTKPTKLEYKYGESLDTSGMSVKAIYDDNQSEVIKSDYSVTGYDKTKSGTQTITVTYRNQTATFDVTVAEPVITKFEITTTSPQKNMRKTAKDLMKK